ncbi:MAG TPA: DUF1080 domain-containing protein [Candidatus Hydrogenedentes bacterium]|nr:DUF1080 domain-containing protein [Candidatus Hydrogenedentota bacterium]HPG67673.1 DUF1080 domain-containing protein [Candidatus Hydrogenedentota bacterium]
MKGISIVLAILGVIVSTGALAEEEGWISLFNGKDLDGWEQKNGLASYTVEDGVIVGTSAPNSKNSFLCTKQHFGDFILEFEFKANPSLNSGVQIRSNSFEKFDKGRVHGYQCELEDEAQNRDWWCGIYDEGRRGWLCPAKEDEAFGKEFGDKGRALWKNGEWNQIRIEAKGDHIQTWLNGELRADLHDSMTPSGFIALQVHGVGDRTEPLSVCWRNIRVQGTPVEPPAAP